MGTSDNEQEVEFKVGDKVMLKIGGSHMIIEEIVGNKAKCVWNEKSGPKTKKFSLDVLRHDKPLPPSIVIMKGNLG